MGQGVSLLPAMAERVDRAHRLVYRRLSEDPPARTIAAIWHRHRYHGAAAKEFLQRLREIQI